MRKRRICKKKKGEMGTTCWVMVNKQDLQTIVNEFESHWVPHTSGLVPQQS